MAPMDNAMHLRRNEPNFSPQPSFKSESKMNMVAVLSFMYRSAEAKGLHQEGVVVEHCCFLGWITNNKEDSQQRQASKRSRAVVASGGITDVDALARVADLLSKIRQFIIWGEKVR